MLLAIHDANLKKVAFIDNEKQDTLNYFDEVWTRNLETGSSTFEFAVFKKSIDKAYSYLNEKAFVSFKYNGKSYVFSVMTVEENEQTITCYCENLNLELINEHTNSYKATKAMSFVEYCNAMGLLSFTYLSIGINEISDQKRTLEWEGQDTKLARLLSLANKFDAEIDFDTQLNADSTIKSFKVNVYHENDGTHQGVGRIRNDIRLTYGKNLKSITRKIDKTNVVNAIRPTGTKDGATVVISGLSAWEEKNADGIVEFYQKGEMLYAPISMQMYPATFTSGTIKDQWTRKDITVDSDNPTVIRSAGIRELKKNAYPAITYDVDGFVDVEIGDTVKIHDDGFNPVLIVEARVADQKISFTNPQSNKTTFANFKALENQLSDGIQKRLNELVEQAKPYTIKLSTDNGVVFKNNIGQSIVTPTLYKGGKPVVANVTWRWALDGNVTTGMTYTVRGADVTGTSILIVSAYIGNTEVATDEITIVNVSDGRDGAKGEKGDPGKDGIAGKDGLGLKSTVITYGLSANETTQPSTWSVAVPTLVKGQYLWTKTVWSYTDSTSETGYQKTYISKDGNSGKDGIAGKDGVGIKSTSITYASSPSGTSTPTSGWSTSVPTVSPGMFLWTKTVWSYTDNTTETGYSVARMGTDGAQGTPGPKGADGKTSYHHWAYSNNPDGTGLTLTDNGQRYMGYYTDYTQADSTDKTKYTWADRWAKIEVGGRNLFLNSKFNFELTKQYSTYYMDASQVQTQGQLVPSIDKDTTFKGSNTLKIVSTFNGTRNNQKITFRTGGDDRTGAVDEMKNQSVMMSFWAKSTVANTIMNWRAGFRNPTKGLTIGTDWTYYSFQLIAPENNNATNEAILHIWTAATVWIAFPKVERGTVSTDYEEAPEDVQSQIDSKADQAKVVYKTDISVTDEGIVHSASKTVNGRTIASMIAQRAEWVEIIAQLLRVKGDMIVDGAITGKKLNVNELSSITSNIGTVNAGLLDLIKKNPASTGSALADDGVEFTYQIPKHETHMTVSDSEIFFKSSPKLSADSNIANAVILTKFSEEGLTFTFVENKNPLFAGGIRLIHNVGTSIFDMFLSSHGKIQINADNYATNYSDSRLKFSRQGPLVTVMFDATSNITGNFIIGNLPEMFRPVISTMKSVPEWNTGNHKRCQMNTDGNLVIIDAVSGQRYASTVSFLAKEI